MQTLFRVVAAVSCCFLFSTQIAHSTIAPVLGPPYAVPNADLPTSYGNTVNEALEIWWPKYKALNGVTPYGSNVCDYSVTYGNEGVFGRIGRVRVNGDCRGSNQIYSTISCPAGYVLDNQLCIATEDPIEEKNTPEPCNSTAHPVNYTTGNKFIEEIDLAPGSIQGLRFHRTWNSFDQQWRFSYRQYLSDVQSSIRTISIYRESGRVVRFNEIDNEWHGDADIRDRLIADNDEWLYLMSTGDKEWFDSSGRLIRIQYTDNRRVELRYPTATLVEVANEYGQSLDIALDIGGRVIDLRDPDGQHYRYAYNSEGDLEHVSYPDLTTDATGDNPFGEDNPYRSYHYEDDLNEHLVTGITDENGDRYKSMHYDGQGRALSSGLGDGSLESSTFDYTHLDAAIDPHVRVRNAQQKDTIYHLQQQHGVTSVTEINGLPSANCEADVQSKTYYEDTGWLKRSFNKAGIATYYEYYADAGLYGLPKKRIEAEGTDEERIFTFSWDESTRRKIEESLIDQWRINYSYGSNDRLLARTITDITAGNVPYSSYGKTREWRYQYSYHDSGIDTQLASIVVDGPRSDLVDSTVYEVSIEGYLTRITDAMGNVSQFLEHNGRGQPTRLIDPNMIETLLTYTPRGWLSTVTVDAGGRNAQTQYDHDAVGQLTRITRPDNSYLEFRYDIGRHLIHLENNLGETIQYSMDDAGNPTLTMIKNSRGGISAAALYTYDELNRLLQQIGLSGQLTQYDYDVSDNPDAVTDALYRLTLGFYDPLNRVKSITDAHDNSVLYSHDTMDRITRITDQRGLATHYIYNGFGNVKQLSSPDTGTTIYVYDEAGNLLQKTDARGVSSHYTYDAINRLTNISYPDEPEKNVSYTYDNRADCDSCNGRPGLVIDASGSTAYFYNTFGQVARRRNLVILPDGDQIAVETEFSYDLNGQLQSIDYPGGRRVSFTRDSTGQVAQISQSPDNDGSAIIVVSDISYRPFGPLQTLHYGNGLQLIREYDLEGRLIDQTIDGTFNTAYSYDAVGNMLNSSNKIDHSRHKSYRYDDLNRLIEAEGSFGSIHYSYDPVGNRTHRQVNHLGMTTDESYILAPDSNQLEQLVIDNGSTTETRSFLYDHNGNLTEQIHPGGNHLNIRYDATNRMDRISP